MEAVCVLVFNEEGKILAVSRKDNPNDFGLPGGKVEKGETLMRALKREMIEETNLYPLNAKYIFTDKEGEYIVHTYLCKVVGVLGTKETGIIKYVEWKDLTENSSFAEYNKKLKEEYNNKYPKLTLSRKELTKLLNDWGNQILNNPVSDINEFLTLNIKNETTEKSS